MNQTTIEVYCTPPSESSSGCSDEWELDSSTSWSIFEGPYPQSLSPEYRGALPFGPITINNILSPCTSRAISPSHHHNATSRTYKTYITGPRERHDLPILVERRQSISGNRARIKRSHWDNVLVRDDEEVSGRFYRRSSRRGRR